MAKNVRLNPGIGLPGRPARLILPPAPDAGQLLITRDATAAWLYRHLPRAIDAGVTSV